MEYVTDNFRRFFKNLNPGSQTESAAAAEYDAIKTLLESAGGDAALLKPKIFLQGSYRQQTAIHDLNDIDLVVLCDLWYPGETGPSAGRSWGRDAIFAAIAAPLLADNRYRTKVRYGVNSMCIKVDLPIKVEILPAVYKKGNNDAGAEPFCLYRPEQAAWLDGFARYHQGWLSWKNRDDATQGNFIPAIKALKHIRTIFGVHAVSFHIECLLFRLSDAVFAGAPADYISAILNTIASSPADAWYRTILKTPCDDRDIFTGAEWAATEWNRFHALMVTLADVANAARVARTENEAIRLWKVVLGDEWFPS